MLKRKMFWMVSAVIIMLSLVGQALSQDSKPLSLEECVKIAIENNSSLRISGYRVESSKASVTTARSALLPSINTSFNSGKYIQGAKRGKENTYVGYDSVANTAIYELQDVLQERTDWNSHSASISLSQNIFDFGRSFNALKQSKASQVANAHTMYNTRNLVIANVKEAYYELLKQYKLRGVYEEALQVAEDQLERVRTMMDIGLASQAEVYQARVVVNNSKTTLINQVNTIEISKASLNNALGRYPNTPLEIISENNDPLFPEFDFEKAVDLALENNENLKSLQQTVKANMYNIRYAKGAFLPSIGANARYSRSNNQFDRVYTDKLDQDFTASIGVGVDLNVFNGFADKASVQRNTIDYNIAVENLEEAKRALLSDVKQYFLQINAYKDIIEMNKVNIEAYEENLRLQQEKRRVGSGTELEVSQAQYDLTRAKSDLISAEFEAKTVKSNLEALLGIIER